MKKMQTKELQQIELKILISFDKICRENGIKYSLGAGTMIGAVRHKGFIPWDDDIDVFMVREEYDRFVNIIRKKCGMLQGGYKVLLPEADGYPYPYIKIINTHTILYEKDTNREKIGVYIDVFPVDYCAQTQKEALKIVKAQKRLFTIFCRDKYRHESNNLYYLLKNLYLFFFKLFHFNINIERRLLQRMNEFSHNKPMPYSGTLVWATSEKDVYPTEYFESYTEMKFENYSFMIFSQYDAILKHRYGNYMELPPKKKRVGHEPEAYWIDDNYMKTISHA